MIRRVLFAMLCVVPISSSSAVAATFIVTASAESGPGSLRQAIADANLSPETDFIHFNIAPGGPQVITVTSNGLAITDGVVIDGTTQPGFAGTPIITLDGKNGNDLTGNGLRVLSPSPSTITGLVIINFPLSGIKIEGGGATIVGNYVGVNASGATTASNGRHGIEVSSDTDGVIIGGSVAQARNVISGNSGNGIQLSSDGNIVEGNLIGLDAGGLIALGNRLNGVAINGGDGNRIGGTSTGSGNVISGNNGFGINVSSVPDVVGGLATGNVIQGNLIGTNVTGTIAVPNTRHGVVLVGAHQTTIGGGIANARNVISGNGFSGIALGGVITTVALHCVGTVIEGNLIGTDITGTLGIGNAQSGVSLVAATDTRIGGATAETGNVISGNGGDGINTFSSSATGVAIPTIRTVISNNRIGTDITGNAALPNRRSGIIITGTQDSLIGGSGLTDGNVISGNLGNGIAFPEVPLSATTTGNAIRGNRIGTNMSGTGALPNGGAGVLFGATTNPLDLTANTIGGTAPGAGNTIWFNGRDGIAVLGGIGNRFLGNSIDSNGELGIDLADDGVTANDAADADTGPNNRQNYPVLMAATVTASTEVIATLNSTPARMFRIEFFNSPAADPSGFGEGRTYLGFAAVMTDAAGNAAFATSLPAVPAGTVITATATDLTTQDTSEFSNAVVAVSVPPILNIGDATVTESNAGTTNAVFNVTLSFPAPADVNFQFATANGTAITPGDYTATSGTGVIAAGAMSTMVTVPVIGDTLAEPDETFLVNVTNITGATRGDVQGQATITNDDVTPIPTFSEWMVVIFAAALALSGAITVRR